MAEVQVQQRRMSKDLSVRAASPEVGQRKIVTQSLNHDGDLDKDFFAPDTSPSKNSDIAGDPSPTLSSQTRN